MKRFLLVAAAIALASLLAANGAWAFGVKDVITLHKGGVADSLIIQKIHVSGTRFHLQVADFRDLKQAGVSDAIVSEMLATEQRRSNSDSGSYYGPYYGSYYYPYPYYYPYAVRYYPSLSLGFSWYGGYGHRYPYHYPVRDPARYGGYYRPGPHR